MEDGQEKKAGWKIWVYLTPVYIIIAVPLALWIQKINSSDLKLASEEKNVFNTDEGEIKRRKAEGYDPGLTDVGYAIRYRPAGAEPGSLQGDGPPPEAAEKVRKEAEARAAAPAEAGRQAASGSGGQFEPRSGNQAALESNETRQKEAMSMGYQKGYMTTAMGKVIGSPKAVGAILNNKYVVEGFMSRPTVKAATGSPEGLANFLKGPGPSNFLNNPVVKAALNNPAVVSAVASSGIVAAMMKTPAAQALMQDPQALGNLVNDNPQLMMLAMQNPQLLNTLMANPDVMSQVGKFDTSKIRKY